MKHHNKIKTLGRPTGQRVALLRGLAISLIEHEKIQTTEAKARALRPYIEKLITKGKKDSVHARRLVARSLGQPNDVILRKIFTTLSERYADRDGGYTRIVKTGETPAGRREAYIEFV